MFERFAAAARSTVAEGIREAERRGDRRIGTQHLLLGLLHDPECAAALGTDLESARGAEDALDLEALDAVGIHPGPIALADPGPRPAPAAVAGRLPFTSAAKDVLSHSVRNAALEHSRTIAGRHVILALLDNAAPDPAGALLARIGVDPAEVRTRLGA